MRSAPTPNPRRSRKSQLQLPIEIGRSAFGLGLLLLSGILMGLWPVWPTAWLCLAPLWYAVQTAPSRREAGLAALSWGLGYHGTVLVWVLHLHPLTWLGIPWLASVAIAIGVYLAVSLWGAGIAVVWALALVSLQRQLSAGPLGQLLLGTTLWCSVEGLWSLSPLYWSSIALTQSPGNLVIVHLARLSGYLGVTAALAAVNGLVAQALAAMGDASGRQRAGRWLAAALALALACHALGWGLYRQPLGDLESEALQVGLIQGNIPTREKLTSDGIKQARQLYLSGYRQLATAGAELVLTPEGALPELWRPRRSPFVEAVQQQQVPLLLGTFTRAPTRSFYLYQSLVAIAHSQGPARQYNKIKLVPLGEYIPLQSVLGGVIDRLSPIGTNMLPGDQPVPIDTGAGLAAAGICYDSAYSWIFRHQVRAGGQFIVTASNNDPYPPRMMAQHHGQDVLQAVATDRWAARVTNTGLSAIVDPHGHSRWMSVPQTYGAHLGTIYRRDRLTPYIRWGNWLLPLLWLVVAGYFIQIRPI